LVGTYVDGVDAGGALLEETVGETAGGRTDIESYAALGVDAKIVESAFELETATADVFLEAGMDFDAGSGANALAGFVGFFAVDLDFTGQNHGLRFLARVGEAAFDHGEIEAFAGGGHAS
jgi:hypothetical protein